MFNKIQIQLNNGYQNVTQLKDDIFAYKEQKDIEYAKNQLAAQGLSLDDPEYESKLQKEYLKEKEQSDTVWGLAAGEGTGELVSTLIKLKTFKYASTVVEGAGNCIRCGLQVILSSKNSCLLRKRIRFSPVLEISSLK